MQRRHVLYMVTDFAPLPSIGRVRTQKMCKFLPESGWRVSVLTVDPPAGTRLDPALLEEIPADTNVYRVVARQPIEASFRWAAGAAHAVLGNRNSQSNPTTAQTADQTAPPDPRASTGSWVQRAARSANRVKQLLSRQLMIPDQAAAAIPAMVSRAIEIIRRDHVDVIVASVPGFSPWLAAVSAGRRTNVPVVVDYRDLWHRDVLRTWIGPVRRRIELAVERHALAQTSAVVTVSNRKTDFVHQLDLTAEGKPFATVPNGFDADDVAGIKPQRLPTDSGKLVLLYAGKLYGRRRIDPIAQSLGRLVTSGRFDPERVRLRLLGSIDADQKQRIERISARHGLGEVIEQSGYVTRQEALAQQLGADALVLIVDPGETSAGVIPGKLTEYIGLRKFVLAVCPPGESRELLDRYGHAVWVDHDDDRSLDAALMNVWTRWQRDPALINAQPDRSIVPTCRQNAEQFAGVLNEVMATSGRRTTEAASPIERESNIEVCAAR